MGRRKGESQEAYEARRRGEGLPYLRGCPGCPRGEVWVEMRQPDAHTDAEGYEIPLCGVCQSRADDARRSQRQHLVTQAERRE